MAWLSRILRWEGAYPQISGNLYKAVVQATLLLGLDTWVITPRIRRTLDIFHHTMDLRLVVMQATQYIAGQWEYPLLYVEMSTLGIEEVETYVLH